MSQPYDVPLFGEPDPPRVQRQQSHKDKDDAKQVRYQRYKGSPRMCQDCFDEKRLTFGTAAFLRLEGSEHRPLCFEHRALRGEAEELRKPRG